MRYALILSIVLALLCVPTSQAQRARWQDLSTVRSGTQVDVVDQQLKKVSGTFVAFSDSDITLQAQGKTVSVPKEQVYRVTVARGRKRNALIGMAAGGVAGAALGLATVLIYRGDLAGSAAVATTSFGAGVGAGIGAAVPPHTTIYRAEPLKRADLSRAPY